MATTSERHDHTKVKTENFSYKWTIENFSLLQHESGQILHSPNFSVGSKNVLWNLHFYPRANKDGIDYVSCFLNLHSKGSAEFGINVRCHFSILKSGKALKAVRFIHNYDALGYWGYPKFMNREELLKECEINDLFTIQCRIEQVLTTVTESVSSDISFKPHTPQLGDDCRQLIKGPNRFSDVTIIVDGKQFSAHKIFLASRSSVFAAMFTHNELKENCTNTVEIEDLEPEVVEGVLEFIYTDEVKNLKGLADRLIGAAQKYELIRLKTMCEETLCKSLDIKNAADLLVLADLYSAPKMLDHVIDFIANHFYQVVKLENYDNINNPDLLKKITRAAAERKG